MDLTDTVALVTGGSGDLGSAIAMALAGGGGSVAVTYVGARDRAERVVAEIEAKGGRAWPIQLDQTNPEMVESAIAATVEHFGRLDILVNNAAWNIGIPFTDLDALTPDIWDRIYDTNARGPFLLARAAARVMRGQRGGHIVNIASVGGIYPAASSVAYATSKAALIHLTRCLAVALAPDILVNCIAPGMLEETRMGQRLPEAIKETARRQALLGHSARLEDIADQVVAFCRSSSTTGQVLPMDGGLLLH